MFRSIVLLVAFAAAAAFGQLWSGNALQKPSSAAITVDGNLDEAVWANLTKTKMDAANHLATGTIDGDGDCYGEFVTMWDAEALYVGLWFHDDIHNAMNSQYEDAANIAYDDDAVEWFFNYSFDDGFNDATGPFYGLYGWQLVKGFGNLDPQTQYGGRWGDGAMGWSTDVYTKAEQEALGWYEVFTSSDGINYTSECKITWAGQIMNSVGTMSANARVGFCMYLDDNDGEFTAQGTMNLTGVSHQAADGSGQHWGLLTLSSSEVPTGIRLVRNPAISKAMARAGNAIYDIQGRKISRSAATNVPRFVIAQGAKASKQLIVR